MNLFKNNNAVCETRCFVTFFSKNIKFLPLFTFQLEERF